MLLPLLTGSGTVLPTLPQKAALLNALHPRDRLRLLGMVRPHRPAALSLTHSRNVSGLCSIVTLGMSGCCWELGSGLYEHNSKKPADRTWTLVCTPDLVRFSAFHRNIGN